MFESVMARSDNTIHCSHNSIWNKLYVQVWTHNQVIVDKQYILQPDTFYFKKAESYLYEKKYSFSVYLSIH